jgi:transposase-like protein
LICQGDWIVPAPRKFDEETRARAVRLYRDRLRDHGESKLAARQYVGRLLGINPATLRNWVEREDGDDTEMSGTGESVSQELRRLRKENADLRTANEILRTASAFFAAADLDRRFT